MSLTPDFLETCRNQKILIIEPFYYTPHVETGLELAEILSVQNSVDYIGPDALRVVTDESCFLRKRIGIQLSRKRNVSRYAGPKVQTRGRAEIASIVRDLQMPDARTLLTSSWPDLASVRFENFDLGMGVFSSLVSLNRNAEFDQARNDGLALDLARDALMLYRLTQELLRSNDYDLVIFFNGRVASARGVRRACESIGVRYIVHERGSSTGKYALFDCATPHQPGPMREWVDQWWRIGSDPESKGRAFLARRRQNIPTNWYSFTGKQQLGHCPPRDTRKRVTFFTSSDDELIAIGDELPSDSPFCVQAHAIRAIGDACRQRGHEFIVRFHPNTPSGQQGLLAAARAVSPMVLEPSNRVDTYALMDSSDVVVTQNSTVGIEAAAVGKPVFYTGRDIFERCTSVRRIMTDADVSAAVDSTEPTDPLDAIRYAYFFGHHGIEHRYYQPKGFLSGSYRGRDLNAPLSTLRDIKLRLTRGGI